MKRLLTIVLCTLLAFLYSPAFALTADEIDAQVDGYFKKSYTTGGALAVILGGEIVYTRYFGLQDSAQEIPVTENTYFRIASVTKMISGIGLMQLKEQGLLELDTDISEYFGYDIANTYYTRIPITLRQIMSHTSSIRGELPGATRTVYDTIAKSVKKRAYFLESKPGSAYAYSNFAAGIAGAMLEAVTGESVNSYMRDNVFTPLSIDAAYTPALLSEPEFIANLYNTDGSRYRGTHTLLDEAYEDCADPETHYRTTIGSLWIRVEDLAKLTIALCGDGSMNGVRVLMEESVLQMRDDQASYQRSVTGESSYGLFLQREDTLIENHEIFGHQGMCAGILCNVYFEPATGFGFVMLTNGCNNVLDNRVGVLSRRLFTYTYESFVESGAYQPYLVQD
ncbi:MAG: beta-lactamase family protein [Clostridiales bacterium]|nr:beta-lactamase family protein [Clostridiales bacterium]